MVQPPRQSFPVPREVVGITARRVLAVSAGTDFSLALDDTGVLHAWGSPTYGVLGHNSDRRQELYVGWGGGRGGGSTTANHGPRLPPTTPSTSRLPFTIDILLLTATVLASRPTAPPLQPNPHTSPGTLDRWRRCGGSGPL